jgi:hypothetical protein
LPALLVDALNEKVVVTIDGERREITKREAVVTAAASQDRRRSSEPVKELMIG